MSTIKEEAKRMIDGLPDDITWDDIMYAFYVHQKVEKAEKFIADGGKTHSMEEVEEHLHQARKRFNKELHTDEYHKIHEDTAHLENLMNFLDVHTDKRYLDLGTGNGYLAFEMARRFPDISVTGLDIAEQAIQLNRKRLLKQGLNNLEFTLYDGLVFPFSNALFGGVISRYAFHHFPDAAFSVQELYRITEAQGFVLISDPVMHEEDSIGFIDQFQKLKQDGHVHFYRAAELDAMFQRHGFDREKEFQSTISFSRKASEEYMHLLKTTPAPLLEKYKVLLIENAVHISLGVRNVIYRKNGK